MDKNLKHRFEYGELQDKHSLFSRNGDNNSMQGENKEHPDTSRNSSYERSSTVVCDSHPLRCQENIKNEKVFVEHYSDTDHEKQDSDGSEETNSSKKISSLGAVYKFSWEIFQEPSYIDVISEQLIQNFKDDESEEGLRRKVIAEARKFFLESPEAKNIAYQNLVKELNNISRHYPTDVPKEHFYYDQELVDKCHKSVLVSKLSDKYSNIVRFLKNASVAIDEALAVHQSQNEEEKRRQHKLLVLALLGQTCVSSSVYRAGGSANPAQFMYKRIHLIGDSQVHSLYCPAAWEGIPIVRPHFHCKDDLSLFTLMEVMKDLIPKVSVKAKMLVVCTVGLRDVVRSIDTLGVFVTLENTITDMKKIREDFKKHYGVEHDLLFADILPLDVCKLLELHKKSLFVNETEELLYQCNETTLRLVKFAYLLRQNMRTEDLSRIRHLPAWDVFVNSVNLVYENFRVKLPSLSEGFEPDMKNFQTIARRVSYFHQAYCKLSEPPNYNTTQRRIFFVCNEKYSAMDKYWPKKKIDEKPTFIFLEQVSSSTILMSLKPHLPVPKDSILVVWFDISELFRPFAVSNCTCKSASLCLDLPHFLKPAHIYDKLILKRKLLEQQCGSPNVILTTLCPINYPDYLKSQFSDHGDVCQTFEAPSHCFLEKINKYLLSVVDSVNLRIVQSNRMRGLPAWDLCHVLYKREQDGSLAFMPPVSPCDRSPARPQTAAKIMMCLSQCGQKTVENLNWLDFCKSYRPIPRKDNSTLKNKFKRTHRAGVRARFDSFVRAQSEFISKACSKSPVRAISLNRSPVRHLKAQVSPQQPTSLITGGDTPAIHRRDSIDSPSSQFNPPPAPHYQEPVSQQDPPAVHANSTKDDLKSQPMSTTSKPSSIQGDPPSSDAQSRDHKPHSGISEGVRGVSQIDVSSPLTLPPLIDDIAAIAPREATDKPVFSRGLQATESADEPHKKRLCLGLTFNKDSKDSLEQSSNQVQVSPPPTTSTSSNGSDFFKPDQKVLENLVASLRAAHEIEVSKLRENPKNHNKYEQQRKEFFEQALKIHDDRQCSLSMDSIERVWLEYWKLKLEASFAKTWEKRVAHLINMISKEKPLGPDTMETLSRLTRVEEPSENTAKTETFTVFETNLLNKFRKRKRAVSNTEVPKEVEKGSGVVLGKKMLAQVQKNWRSIGCKASQIMLNNALVKLDGFITSSKISVLDLEEYNKLRCNIGSFKTFLQKKEGNPFDLDFKSLSQITKSFTQAETAEYVEDVLRLQGIENPAKEDIDVTCDALNAQVSQKKLCDFVNGPVIYW
ncbi:hypothetical protein FHG87_000864 [Trinorchestia longiramus]|nr:hypothetical protein FHG87_000864 [Trinorchestia longiramus]